MNNLQALTSRVLRIRIKENATTEELCSKYRCTEDELKDRIFKLYTHSKQAKDIWNKLEANRKINRKASMKQPVSTIEETAQPEETTVTENVTTVIEDSNTPETVTVTLEELLAKEEDLSKKIMEIETERKRLVAEHVGYLNNVRAIGGELRGISESLASCQARYDEAIEKANSIVAVVTDKINPVLRSERAALEAVRREIEAKKTVTLFVYEDGHIEAPDHPSFVLEEVDSLELKKLKNELGDLEECQNLRVCDVLTLARLLIISKGIEHFELVFESVELERVFGLVRDNLTPA